MPTDAHTARALTRRLVAHAATYTDGSNGAARAVYVASESACRELSRSLGPTGFNALLTRALAQTQIQHPVLKALRIERPAEPVLGGVEALAEQYGDLAVIAGLEAMLETLFGLLGRLIGDDMVPRLVERAPVETHDDEDVK
jgi:hypothetical protein